MTHDPGLGDWIGQRVTRKEDRRLVTGQGQYLADLPAARTLHLMFVRSQRAHALIRDIDVAAARALPGVVAIVTGADIRDCIKPFPVPSVTPRAGQQYPTFWPLAVDKVKFHGEPVAAIVAIDRYIAEDAAELVEVSYEDLPVMRDMERALDPGAPRVHPDFPSNLLYEADLNRGDTPAEKKANAERVARLLEDSPIRIKRRFRVHRCGTTPLETRGMLATWSESDGLTAWITTQRQHIERLALADALDLPTGMVRVITPPDQGGGFGVKAPIYREPILVCHMARVLGRPVRWVESREEHLMSVGQERDQIHDLEIGATREGRIVALRDRIIADGGDGCAGIYWAFRMPALGAMMLPNCYDLPDCDVTLKVVMTNKAVLAPARAYGSLPGRFALDRAIMLVARETGLAPSEVSRRNMITTLPHKTATGYPYDSGNFLKVWDTLLDLVDVPKFRAEQRNALAEGRHIGLGFGASVSPSGSPSDPGGKMPGFGAATIRVDPRGQVSVIEGDTSQGQSHETTIAQVVAQEFGIDIADVRVTGGDSATAPFAIGATASRGASQTISAVVQACRALAEKMARFIIHDLQIDAQPEDFAFTRGQIVLRRDPNIRRDFAEMANRIIMAPINLPPGQTGGLEQTAFFEAAVPMVSFSAHAAIVEVEAATGRFKILRYLSCEDVGTVINPMVVEGQVHGGVAQGISNTLFEEFVYDEEGQQLSSSLESYKMANACDLPNIEVHHGAGTPSPHTPLGTRGIGEGTPGPAPAALTNAVCDALAPFGIEINELPLRPEKIWRAIQQSERQSPVESSAS
jgi:carbon-monoxide dehydrogenase large subunit